MAYLIALIIVLLPTYLIRFSIFGIPLTVLEVLIYIIFLIGLWQAKKQGFKKPPILFWLPPVLLLIAAIISTFVSPLKHEALGELKAFFIDPLLVLWLLWQFFKKEDFPKIIAAFALTGLFVAVHAIVQKFLGQVTTDGRVVGIFGFSPNYLALFLSPIAVLLAAQSFQFQKKKKHLLLSLWPELIFIVILVAIYYSGSRGGLLAVAGGLAILAIFHFWDRIRTRLSAKIIIAILIILALYTSWSFFKPDFNVSVATGGRVVTSNNVRWQIWDTSLKMIQTHPVLGVGLANYQNFFTQYTKGWINFDWIAPVALTSHNIFLMFYLTTGLLGILAFLFSVAVFFWQSIKRKSNLTPYLVAVFSSILIYGLIDTPYWKNDLSLIYWIIWGLVWVV